MKEGIDADRFFFCVVPCWFNVCLHFSIYVECNKRRVAMYFHAPSTIVSQRYCLVTRFAFQGKKTNLGLLRNLGQFKVNKRLKANLARGTGKSK